MLTLGISVSEAQDLKRFMKKREDAAKDAAGERVGKEADKKIAKEINKGFDRLFGAEEESTEEPSGQTSTQPTSRSSSSQAAQSASMQALMGAMGMNANVNVKDQYTFDSFVEMTITNYDADGNKDESGKYITYLDSKSLDYGIQFTEDNQQETSIMIFDTQNGLMLTLVDSDGQKSGFAVGFDTEQIEQIAEEYETESDEDVETDTDNNPYNLKKTGKTKTISGYRCDEYMMEDESNIVRIWATDDVDKGLKNAYLTNNNFAGMFFYAYYMDGLVMEYDITEKSDNDRMVMTVTDLDLNKTTSFNTGSYNIMSMGAMEEEPEE
jgi:hypothetical protein